MSQFKSRLIVFLSITGLTIGFGTNVMTLTSDSTADLVLGRETFTENTVCDNRGLNLPKGIVIDSANSRVYVAEENNNRILWWNSISSLVNNDDADGVIGQADFHSSSANGGDSIATAADVLNTPTNMAIDGSGNLWVADYNNNRVLRFSYPTTSSTDADLVLGQADFISRDANRGGSAAANTLNRPFGIAVDASGSVWVAERNNNRILRYSSPFSNGQDADLVLGQADFTSSSINRGGSVAANSLYRPYGLKADTAGNVWVADRYNHRVLRFSSPFSNGQDADLVLGQADFTSRSMNRGTGVAANTLSYPTGIIPDGSTGLWIADESNHRMLKYSLPAANGADADLVLGQADFISNSSNQGGTVQANTLYDPQTGALDSSGNLWVSDSLNHRILKYNSPSTDGADADLVLGSEAFTDGVSGNTYPGSLRTPYGTVIDRAIGRMYIADPGRHRVLWWDDISSLTNGQDADGVIGQADMYAGLYNRTGSLADVSDNGLYTPRAVAVDNEGSVWIVDQNNNRILKFNRPETNGESAVLVLGQADFISSDDNRGGSVTANGLNGPRGTFIDTAGNVWVADRGNNRVLRYSSPAANGADADLVLGQPDFTSNSSNRGGDVGANTLSSPQGLALDRSGRLWVADGNNNRIVMYQNPSANGTDADLVLGQMSFTENSANQGGSVGANTLDYPIGIARGRSNTLWVCDGDNNRVLRYTAPSVNGADADLVLGQDDFTNNGANHTEIIGNNGFDSPAGIAFDDAGSLWITDFNNGRALFFIHPDEFAPQAPENFSVE